MNSLRIGGSQTVALALASEARRRGWDVTVAAGGGVLEDEFRREGVRVVRLLVREGTANDLEGLRGWRRVRGTAREVVKTLGSTIGVAQLYFATRLRPGVIHASQPWPVTAAAIVGLITGDPVVWHAHGTSYVEMPLPHARAILPAVRAYVGISKEVADALLSLTQHGDRVVCLRSPVRMECQLPVEPRLQTSDAVIGVCATLTDNKRDYVLATMRAAGLLASDDRRVRLLVVGDGPCRDSLAAEASLIEKGNECLRIVMMGESRRVAESLRAADVVVGMGQVAIEAAIVGHRVVCASSEGLGGVLNAESFELLERTNFTGRGVMPLTDILLAAECVRALEAPVCANLRGLLREAYGPSAFEKFEALWLSLLGAAVAPAD